MTDFYLKLKYENGDVVSKEKVVFRWKRNHERDLAEAETNEDGVVQVRINGIDTIERLEVAGKVVREDWYFGDKKEVEEHMFLPDPQAEFRIDDDTKEVQSIKGRLYYYDGTQLYQEIKVSVEVPGDIGAGEQRYHADNNGHSEENGEFFIQLPKEMEPRHFYELSYFIAGEKIDDRRIHYANNYSTIILPEINWIGKKGQEGGVITGKVVDKNGSPIEGIKVEATVDKTGFLGNMLNSDIAEAKTNRSGRFALGFSGGTAIKKITVNGDKPERVYKNRTDPDTGEKTEVDLDPSSLRAGSFNLIIQKPSKLFGFI